MMTLPAPVIYALGIAGAKLISLVSLPIVARGLGPESYGNLDVLVLMIDAMSLVMGFGLVDASQRFLAMRKQIATDPIQSTVLCAANSVLLATIAVTGTSASFIFVILSEMKFLPFESVDLLLATLAASGSAYLLMPMMLLRLHGRATQFVKLGLSIALCQSVTAILSVQMGWGVRGILMGSALIHTLGAGMLAILFLHNFGWCWNNTLVTKLFRYAWPMAVGGAAAFLFNGFERWWLAGTVSAQTLGSYSATWKLTLLAVMATQAFQLWWSPRRMILIANGRHSDLVRFASLGVLWATAVVISVAIMAPVLFSVLFGSEFQFSPKLSWLLLTAVLLRIVADILNVGCFISDQPRAQMVIQLATALVTLLCLPYLIFTMDAIGAAVALVIGSTFRLVTFYLVSQRYLPVAYPIIRLAGIAITMAIFALYLINNISTAPIGIPSYLTQIALFWIVFLSVIGLFGGYKELRGVTATLPRAGCHD